MIEPIFHTMEHIITFLMSTVISLKILLRTVPRQNYTYLAFCTCSL